jgi:hypothetical protein
MPTWLKVTLVVVGLVVVLFVAAIIAGVYAVRRYGPELVEAGKQTVAEGEEYGRRTDNEGCLNEAVARQARAEGFRDMLKNSIFTRSCLEASRPTPGFCDAVPRQVEFMKAISWQMQQCKQLRPAAREAVHTTLPTGAAVLRAAPQGSRRKRERGHGR